jgi:putative FmdB family regulatory protein
MPVYSYECPKHGRFDLTLPLRKWDDHKNCPKCGRSCEQVVLPQGEPGTLPIPIVVHRDEKGNFRFPGASDARVPKHFEKVELKTIKEVEKFEREVNQRLHSEARQHQENEERFYGQVKKSLRSELVNAMQSFSNRGKDFARLVMALNDARRRKKTEVGFHCDILHNDASNREAYNDERTGWKRKYF